MHEPGTLDGGDVLFTGHRKQPRSTPVYEFKLTLHTDIFVGLSRRTNQSGVDQLAAAFPKYKGMTCAVS